jgi:uncharacterized protein YajQ (UPF0234 family)
MVKEQEGGGNYEEKIKYKKSLSKKTLEKIQNICKNKKIKTTKKYNGKIVNLQKKTLINTLVRRYAWEHAK